MDGLEGLFPAPSSPSAIYSPLRLRSSAARNCPSSCRTGRREEKTAPTAGFPWDENLRTEPVRSTSTSHPGWIRSCHILDGALSWADGRGAQKKAVIRIRTHPQRGTLFAPGSQQRTIPEGGKKRVNGTVYSAERRAPPFSSPSIPPSCVFQHLFRKKGEQTRREGFQPRPSPHRMRPVRPPSP